MAEVAATLEGAGFAAFLPQRDGLLFTELFREMRQGGYDLAEAAAMARQAIFWLGAYQAIQGCDGILVNLNGRVPDEGAVAEAALAWMAGKPVVLYKADARSLCLGSDHPLVTGLGGFVGVSTVPEIAYAFTQIFRARRRATAPSLPTSVQQAVAAGRRLARTLATHPAPPEMVSAIVALSRAVTRSTSR